MGSRTAMMKFGALCISIWLCCGATAMAQQGPLKAAIDLWLSGNDRDSLALLAEHASAGNPAARILLAQLEVKDRGHSPYRASLKPADARAIFRQDAGYGGFSKSWLAIEAGNGNALAKALLDTRHPRPDSTLITRLRAMGEVEATDYPIRVVGLYGTPAQKQVLLSSDAMLEELRPYLVYLNGEQTWRGEGVAALRHIAPFAADLMNAKDEDTVEIGGLLALGFLGGGTSPDNKWRGLVENWVLTAPQTRPIAELCRTECPGEVTGCGFAMLALTGGYYEVIRLDTPLETLISQDRFLDSPRARLMTLRRAAMAKQNANRGWLADRDEIATMSSCAAELVERTRAEYE